MYSSIVPQLVAMRTDTDRHSAGTRDIQIVFLYWLKLALLRIHG